MQKRTLYLLLILYVLPWLGCQSDVETIEVRNEYGQLERFERRKKDFAKEGLYQRYHEDGYLLEEAHYANDSLQGERKFFFPNGKTERIEHHQHGVFHGKYQQFYETGQIQL